MVQAPHHSELEDQAGLAGLQGARERLPGLQPVPECQKFKKKNKRTGVLKKNMINIWFATEQKNFLSIF